MGRAFFVVNLLQDVSILRPLIFMTARDLNLVSEILVTKQFIARDKSETWLNELTEISESTNTPLTRFGDPFEALYRLQNESGLLIAASESNLSAHTATHDLFRLAPSSFVKITLQHGFECVGFLQSHDHDLAHGQSVTFAADVVCGWADQSRLVSMLPSQRPKLYVTGPPPVLQLIPNEATRASGGGLVCENLHSPRLNAAGDFASEFMQTFDAFCTTLKKAGRTITLRPHPGGQYVLKKNVPLSDNVTLNNSPIYKANLAQYAFGISAPSTVLIDMIFAGIPVAMWLDKSGLMDGSNYRGLTEIRTVDEWIEFSHEATAHPEGFISAQQQFLNHQKMPTEPREIFQRFAHLFRAAAGVGTIESPRALERILFIANGYIPTLQLSFMRPLAKQIENGEIETAFITEQQLIEMFGKQMREEPAQTWISRQLLSFKPTLIVFCRYSGPHFHYLIDWAKGHFVKTIYQIDDDLLKIPPEIGQEKYRSHTDPIRVEAVRYLLDNVNLVYASTENLAERLRVHGIGSPLFVAQLYCSGIILNRASHRPVQKIGYMGFDHTHDFATVLTAIVQLLRRNTAVCFQLFGSIPKPKELDEFGPRVSVIPAVRNYEDFLRTLADLNWDIGVCPLALTDFNAVKANTKWVEYTAAGAAVVATRGTIYDDVCSDDCGLLAASPEEWLSALERLIKRPNERFALVQKAQARLENEYTIEQLRKQVFQAFARSRSQAKERVLLIANDIVPTLQLSFVKPLAPLLNSGEFLLDFLTVHQMKERGKYALGSNGDWVVHRLNSFKPTILIFCRYNGPFSELIVQWARDAKIPIVFHIDDDLMNVPVDLGQDKHAYHNDAAKLKTIRYLLDSADLVYASTRRLEKRLHSLGIVTPTTSARIYCSGEAISPATERPFRKFGYMASADHTHNFGLAIPAIVHILRRYPSIKFELFGSIPKPRAFLEFGDRITTTPPVSDYKKFLEQFAKYEWDVGVCPLSAIDFNLMKANTKWVEYTSVGAAVVASRGTVYDECCANGCGLLASSTAEWIAALERLIQDPRERFEQVRRAQQKLATNYSVDSLRSQVIDIFKQAHEIAAKRNRR